MDTLLEWWYVCQRNDIILLLHYRGRKSLLPPVHKTIPWYGQNNQEVFGGWVFGKTRIFATLAISFLHAKENVREREGEGGSRSGKLLTWSNKTQEQTPIFAAPINKRHFSVKCTSYMACSLKHFPLALFVRVRRTPKPTQLVCSFLRPNRAYF